MYLEYSLILIWIFLVIRHFTNYQYKKEWIHFIPTQFNNAESEILPRIKNTKNK